MIPVSRPSTNFFDTETHRHKDRMNWEPRNFFVLDVDDDDGEDLEDSSDMDLELVVRDEAEEVGKVLTY